MFDLKLLQKQPESVRKAIDDRNGDSSVVDQFLAMDGQRRSLLTEVETLKNERNRSSVLVAEKKKKGQDAAELLAELSSLSERIKKLDQEASLKNQELSDILLGIPNIPHSSVPYGKNSDNNPVIASWGNVPGFDFPVKDHVDIGTSLGGLDFERAGKIAGARFVVYRDWAARLERALISFMLDLHTKEHGYTEILPPLIVNRQSLVGTGQLPKFSEDLFALQDTDQFLIPTAEVPVTNLHRDETLPAVKLPIAYVAYSSCFRSEAGSYGKDVRGIIRQHQFNKVELVRFCKPEDSYEQLDLLRGHAEEVLQRLELSYRVIALCTGDLGFSAAKTYDLEVWLPGQQAYREISSCSNFEDFQARRAGIRYKAANEQKSQLVHTLNGSGLAVGRTMVAILENYQQRDGSVIIPEALRSYMGGQRVIA